MKTLFTAFSFLFCSFTFAQLTADISVSANTVCRFDSVLVTFQGYNGSIPYTFTYSIDGGATTTISSSTADTALWYHTSSQVGVFNYSLLAIEDNNGTMSSVASSVTITVNPLPTATIVGDITVCVGDPYPAVTFTGANATAPYTFEYHINSSPTQTLTSIGNTEIVEASTDTAGVFVYYLTGVTDNSTTQCYQDQTGEITVIVEQCVGLKVNENENLNLHPNPANEKVILTGILLDNDNSVMIMDLLGNELMVISPTGNIIDISTLKSGVYLLKVGDRTVRFVKE